MVKIRPALSFACFEVKRPYPWMRKTRLLVLLVLKCFQFCFGGGLTLSFACFEVTIPSGAGRERLLVLLVLKLLQPPHTRKQRKRQPLSFACFEAYIQKHELLQNLLLVLLVLKPHACFNLWNPTP